MPIDVYQPCPYCEERKIKFCCADIADEMSKIMRQHAGGQQRSALKHLEKLAETHPGTIWNQMVRATILLELKREDEALPILTQLQEASPKNKSVAYLRAWTAFVALDGDGAREVIWHALRLTSGPSPIAYELVRNVAYWYAFKKKHLAARKYLSLGLQLAAEEDRATAFENLMEFDNDRMVPYPLRGPHALRPVSSENSSESGSDDEWTRAAAKAIRLAERGCFGPAADRLATLAEQRPDDAAIAYNAGLCRAWAGDRAEAAVMLMRAARIETDFDLAVEYALLSQLLSSLETRQANPDQMARLPVHSIENVVAAFNEWPYAARQASEEDPEVPAQNWVFALADRPIEIDSQNQDTLEISDIANVRCLCAIVGADGQPGGNLRIMGMTPGQCEPCVEQLRDLLGEELGPASYRPSNEDAFLLPEGFESLHQRPIFPSLSNMKASTKGRLRKQYAHEAFEAWRQTPQVFLEGRTPQEAASTPEKHVELAALCEFLNIALIPYGVDGDPAAWRSRLGLPQIAPFVLEGEHSLHTASTLQVLRISVRDVESRQLKIILSRAELIGHNPFLKAVLQEAYSREEPEFDQFNLAKSLMHHAHDDDDPEEALRWNGEARRFLPSLDQEFVERFGLDYWELTILSTEGDSPKLQEALGRFVTAYRAKVPEMVERLVTMVSDMGIEVPPLTSDGGLWTPDKAPAPAQGKLWLPGS